MSRVCRRPPARRAVRSLRSGAILGLALVVAAFIGLSLALTSDGRDGDAPAEEQTVRIVAAGGQTIEAPLAKLRSLSDKGLDRWLKTTAGTRKARDGAATVTFKTDVDALRTAIRERIASGAGTVELPERRAAATVRLPIVKQALRNNCETAALSMLLAARGSRVPQLKLQEQLPTSGPLDPQPSAGGGMEVWGDPSRGFVGRADGGGTSGGYGVYEPPIAALAERHGVDLTELSRQPAKEIYDRLLAGSPVMVWIGLSDGPYETWRGPQGGKVTGNFGEHTVVLTGIRGKRLYVNDPLVGERTTWTRGYFEELWERLGRRALSV